MLDFCIASLVSLGFFYGIMMVSLDTDFWLCDVLRSETQPLPEFGATFAIDAYDCVVGKNIAFECNSDAPDFDAVEFDNGRPNIIMYGDAFVVCFTLCD